MKILVSGAAGFIGYHLCLRLLERGDVVVGYDNFNPYYDPALKRARLARLEKWSNFRCVEGDLEDGAAVADLFAIERPQRIVNLAAQAGVRHSLDHPNSYIQSNLVGFGNILEGCRNVAAEHLVYASSSSVYGGNVKLPFEEHQDVSHPLSLYAASKKANELMAHSYSHLYGLPTTGLRFFTAYGPWGRPDMALFVFTRAILARKPIQVFNHGQMIRDFTYIDDIVEAILRVLDKAPKPDPSFASESPDPSTSWAPYRIYNVGNSQPTQLLTYIEALEEALGVNAVKQFLPLQPGDVPQAASDTTALERSFGFRPNTPVREGVRRFVTWFREFYGV